MNQDRIQELFERMRKPGSGLDSDVQVTVTDVLVGRGLEACIPVLEAAHDLLLASGLRYLSDGVTARAVACPTGPHGGVWRKAVLLYGEGTNLLAVMEVGGEPDPESSDFLLERLGGTAPARSGLPGPCHSVNVYRINESADIAAALAGDAAGRQVDFKVLDGAKSFATNRNGRKWLSCNNKCVSDHGGFNEWQPLFVRLEALFRQVGLSDMMRSAADEMAEREWVEYGVEFDDCDAAAEFGNQAAGEDGYLPGRNCLAALDALDSLSAEAQMERLLAMLRTISSGLAAHPALVEDGSFDANDGRNVVRPVSATGAGFDMDLEDQNSRHLVRQIGTHIDLVGQRREGSGDRDCLRLSFDPDAGGRMRMSGVIGQGMDAIRCWNGFVSAVETLECCVTDEIARQAAPSGP